MINWYLVVLGPLGVLVGMEIARRKTKKDGIIFSFQPLWTYRLMMSVISVSAILFVEAARAALADPTSFHLWTLILSAGTAQLALMISSCNEVRCARQTMVKAGTPTT